MRQKTLLKIVGLMRKDLNKGLTILEISKKLKIGYRPAYNHISEMEKEGIIKISRVSRRCLVLGLKKFKEHCLALPILSIFIIPSFSISLI